MTASVFFKWTFELKKHFKLCSYVIRQCHPKAVNGYVCPEFKSIFLSLMTSSNFSAHFSALLKIHWGKARNISNTIVILYTKRQTISVNVLIQWRYGHEKRFFFFEDGVWRWKWFDKSPLRYVEWTVSKARKYFSVNVSSRWYIFNSSDIAFK